MQLEPLHYIILTFFALWGWSRLAFPIADPVTDAITHLAALVVKGDLPEKLAHLPIYAHNKVDMVKDVLELGASWRSAFLRVRWCRLGAGSSALGFAALRVFERSVPGTEALAVPALAAFVGFLGFRVAEARNARRLQDLITSGVSDIIDKWHAELTKEYVQGGQTGSAAA